MVLNEALIVNEVIGIIGTRRGGWSVSQIFEAMCLTGDRVIVARTAQGGVFGGELYWLGARGSIRTRFLTARKRVSISKFT